MATVASVALTQPSSDPSIDEGQTFTIGGQITKANHGGLDYDLKFQWDQGTGSWVDIPTSGSTGLTVNAQPAANIADEVEYTGTVTGHTNGSYSVRVQTVDHNDTDATDTSGTQAVTVNVGAVAYTLDVNSGSVSISGSSVGVNAARKLSVSSGSVSITGASVDLTVGAGVTHYTLDINSGSISLSGQNVSLDVARSLSLSSGSVGVTGASVELYAGKALSVNSGTVAISGGSVDLKVDRSLSLSSGSIAIAGDNVDLTYAAGLTHYTLDVSSGGVVISGGSVGLTYSGFTPPQVAKINGIDVSTILYIG